MLSLVFINGIVAQIDAEIKDAVAVFPGNAEGGLIKAFGRDKIAPPGHPPTHHIDRAVNIVLALHQGDLGAASIAGLTVRQGPGHHRTGADTQAHDRQKRE